MIAVESVLPAGLGNPDVSGLAPTAAQVQAFIDAVGEPGLAIEIKEVCAGGGLIVDFPAQSSKDPEVQRAVAMVQGLLVGYITGWHKAKGGGPGYWGDKLA